MTDSKKLLIVLATLASFLVFPYLGAHFYYNGNFPEGHFAFPPLVAPAKAPFNLTIFIIIWIMFFVTAALYVLPRLFGFKKVKVEKEDIPKVKLPSWFWIGFFSWIIPLIALVGKFEQPRLLINWADLPMFWGFAMMIDAIVYKRTGGKSILSQYPKVLIGIGIASISGWMIFEYLNFFVDDNWIYPKGDLISQAEFVTYAFLGSSGLMPMAFEMHSLLNSFPSLKNKYSNGPKMSLPGWIKVIVFIACIGSLVFINVLPDELFFALWFSPLLMLGIILSELKIWTPFTPMKDGNWGPAMLFALAFYFQGILHECWNYISGVHENGQMVFSNNPDYWSYSIPYVNVWHVFEMPFLGLMGYLPFGIYCAVWWITFAFVLNIPTQFHKEQEELDQA